jgi:hypothetical protein
LREYAVKRHNEMLKAILDKKKTELAINDNGERNMTIEWTIIGKEYTAGKETELRTIFDNVVWHEFKDGTKEGMMPALAINGIITQIANDGSAKPLNYAISTDLAPLGLYAIEFEYSNATAKTYWVDNGVEVSCIALEPNKVEVKP